MIGPGDSAPKLSAQTTQTGPKPGRGGETAAAGPDRRAARESGDESAAARPGTGEKGEARRDGFAALVSDGKAARADKASPAAERGAKPSGRQAAADGALFTGEPQTATDAASTKETGSEKTAAKATATKATGEAAAAEGGETLQQSGDPLASETPGDGATAQKPQPAANAAAPAPQEQAPRVKHDEAPTADPPQPAEASPPPERPSARTAASAADASEAPGPQAAHAAAAPTVEPGRTQAREEQGRARQARAEAAPAAETGRAPEPRAAPLAPLATAAESSRPTLPGASPALATDEGLSAALPGAESARREIAAPPAPPPVSADPGRAQAAEAARVIGQITVATSRSASDQVQIRLDPPELGRVSLHFTMTDDGISALVTADRAETVDLLRRNAEMLQRDLTGAGYRNVTLDFGGGGETGQQGSGDGEPGRQAEGFEAGDEIVSTYRRATLPGHLDIRF